MAKIYFAKQIRIEQSLLLGAAVGSAKHSNLNGHGQKEEIGCK
jgi:hypothetical protein